MRPDRGPDFVEAAGSSHSGAAGRPDRDSRRGDACRGFHCAPARCGTSSAPSPAWPRFAGAQQILALLAASAADASRPRRVEPRQRAVEPGRLPEIVQLIRKDLVLHRSRQRGRLKSVALRGSEANGSGRTPRVDRPHGQACRGVTCRARSAQEPDDIAQAALWLPPPVKPPQISSRVAASPAA